MRNRTRRSVLLGCTLLAGAVLIPITAMGVLSSTPAGASSSAAGFVHPGAVAQAPITRVATAPGSYSWTVTFGGTLTETGTLTISSNGTFSSTLPSDGGLTQACSGVWTTSGKYIAMDLSGSTSPAPPAAPCTAAGFDVVFAGHVTGNGIKSGTLDQAATDANGVPTATVQTGTWSAVRR